MASGHTPRSMKHLRDEGFPLVQVVEQWVKFGNSGAGVRRDLWGMIDIMAARRNDILGVQVTSAGQFTAHLKMMREHTTEVDGTPVLTAGLILSSGMRLEVHGWEKVGRRYEMTRKLEFTL